MATQHDPAATMSPADSAGGGHEGPPLSAAPRHRRWRRWALLAVAIASLALVALSVLASRYQPVGYGNVGSETEAFPGLPTGIGIRPVNNLGGFHEDMYVPPQRGTFSLFADITNNGTHPVTIVSASLGALSPFSLSGPIRYSLPGMGGSHQLPPPTSRVLHDVVLEPGQNMFLGFPVHMWPCATTQGWMAVSTFNVRTSYLAFSHVVAVPWGFLGDSLILRSPGGRPGQKDVICAAGTTRANLPKVPVRNPQPQTVAGTIIRISKRRDAGALRLMEMTDPAEVKNMTAPSQGCLQYPPDPVHAPDYRIVNFALNYSEMRHTAPAVRITIAGPDGEPMIADIPSGQGGGSLTCRSVQSFLLRSQGGGWQLVYGLSLRVPLDAVLNHLLITADGRTITVPLVPACRSASGGLNCFAGDEMGGSWMAGTPYSVSLRV